MSKKITIILLNGVGSVGKTSIAQSLQKMFPEPYLHIGIDHFLMMLPQKYLPGGSHAQEGVDFITKRGSSSPITQVHCGKMGQKLFRSMKKCMLSIAEDGFNLIIDEVIIGNELEEYKKLFKDFHLVTVGVFAPLDIIEKREKERQNRVLGLARWQYDIVHKNKKYDIELDTTELLPEQCAKKIIEFINL